MNSSILELISGNSMNSVTSPLAEPTSTNIGTLSKSPMTTPFLSFQPLEAQTSSKAGILTLSTGNCFNQTISSQSRWGLTGSAPSATALSGILPTNNNSWAMSTLVPATQPSPSMFAGKGSTIRVLWEDASVAFTFCCLVVALL